MSGERTEKATPKRRQDERKKGNIFQSKEVSLIFSLILMFYLIKTLSPFIYKTLSKSIEDFISLSASMDILTVADTRKLFIDGLIVFTLTVMPLLAAGALFAIVFAGVQTRFNFSAQAMQFKMSRLNPISGLKKMVSMRSLMELLKALIKISVLGYIIYNSFLKTLPLMPGLMDMSVMQALIFLGDTVMSIVTTIASIFIFVAALDYFFQWWEHEKNLRMSKQEIKEEYKQMEGDPQQKGKIREKQRQRAMSRMMQSVPSADVIVRNPTHYAVALKYDPEKNKAPILVAKGADLVAKRIIELAEKNDIVITENKPLARGLYESVDIDREIPEQFYQAVAEVLAFVFSIKRKDLR